MIDIDIKIVNDKLFSIPSVSTSGSAGYDLHAMIDSKITIDVNACVKISSGIAIHISDPAYAGFIFARSGLAIKHGLVPGNCVGVIDSDYQGEIQVAIWNRSDSIQDIFPLERIAQLVFMPIVHVRFNVVNEFFNKTNRGSGGFGSTGFY
jgi:dUTP pyrophosphatase